MANLFIFTGRYRGINKSWNKNITQDKQPARWYNFLKDQVVEGEPYLPANPSENVTYGDMVLVSGVYIIPTTYLRKIEGKELEDVVNRITDIPKKDALKKQYGIADTVTEDKDNDAGKKVWSASDLSDKMKAKLEKIDFRNPSRARNYAVGALIGGTVGVLVINPIAKWGWWKSGLAGLGIGVICALGYNQYAKKFDLSSIDKLEKSKNETKTDTTEEAV